MPEKKTVRRRERRRMSRAEAQLSMRVEGGGSDGALVPIVTESRNISGSGVYCLSPYYLAPLSKVALTIVLPAVPGRNPSQRLLKCEGLVVRCRAGEGAERERSYELACSFLGLEGAVRERLEEYVVWRNLQALRTGPRRAAGRPAAARRRRRTAAPGGATARGTSGSREASSSRRASASRSVSATQGAGAGRTDERKRRTVH